MDDELEDRLFYQIYVSHAKLVSRFAVGIPFNSGPVKQAWKMVRLHILRPEFIILGGLLVFMLIYLQTVDVWSRNILAKVQHVLARVTQKPGHTKQLFHYQVASENYAAYAICGKRHSMEDRLFYEEDINSTGVSVYAVFDGHGGVFAADYALDKLMPVIRDKIINIHDLAAGKYKEPPPEKAANVVMLDRKDSFKRPADSKEKEKKAAPTPKPVPISAYLDTKGKRVDYGRLLTDELVAGDSRLVEEARSKLDVAGSTALISVLDGTRLVVANVGDSRGVMCNSKGAAVPLSFDHKPQEARELKRIVDAGGHIAYNGVWRVLGILATSRALGDYPLKEKKYVTAEPDILTFDLKDHRPSFAILATDGLWDVFSNEEAVAFVKQRLDEPHFGAKSIVLESYNRGSEDNISVLVIKFKRRQV